MTALDIINSKATKADRRSITAKIKASNKDLVDALREEKQMDTGEILDLALDPFFEGYEPTAEEEIEEVAVTPKPAAKKRRIKGASDL